MRTSRMFWAILLVGMGFLFLANNLGLVSIDVWGLFWPVFLGPKFKIHDKNGVYTFYFYSLSSK